MDRNPSIPVASLLDTLLALNPWWTDRPFTTGVIRDRYFARLRAYLDTREIVVVTGVRRAGKTTLLYQCIDDLVRTRGVPARQILFVNFDEPGLLDGDDPIGRILETYRREIYAGDDPYLVFDEVQHVPCWERQLKSLYDRHQARLIVSGSSAALLDTSLSGLLSGRYLALTVYPLDFTEYLAFIGHPVPDDPLALAASHYDLIHRLREYLVTGGFPRAALEPDSAIRADLLSAYFDSIVQRDIVLANAVRDVRGLHALLTTLFANVSTLISYRRLADQLGLDSATVREYLWFATQARILFEVPLFSYKVSVQNRNNRKCYCIDTGLRNAVAFRFSEDEGRLLENLVFLHLIRRGGEVYYWKGTGEVDFVWKRPDHGLVAINVTATDEVPAREVAALRDFAEVHGDRVEDLILLTADTTGSDGPVRFVPAWRWLLEQDAVFAP